MSLDISLDQLPRLWIHRHRSRAVDHAVGDDGLRVNAREGLGALLGEDSGLVRHDGYSFFLSLLFSLSRNEFNDRSRGVDICFMYSVSDY